MEANVSIKRWQFLKECIIKKKIINNENEKFSVRRFTTFNIFEILPINDDQLNDNWFTFCSKQFPALNLHVRILELIISSEQLIGFNNTGNICVWPSEEVLAFYCLTHLSDFIGANICELGGGMTCLAALTIAQLGNANDVLLSDGNELSLENLKLIIEANSNTLSAKNTISKLLRWGEYLPENDLNNKFDFILSSDCLFFEDLHKSFIEMILYLLKPGGKVIIFAPKRGKSFENFYTQACQHFIILENTCNYDDNIFSMHQQNLQKGPEFYDVNLHFPQLLLLQKSKEI